MKKALNLLLAAVAVIAFAVPAMASASTGLTSPKGTLVPVGTAIRFTFDFKITSSKFGPLTCGNAVLPGKVVKNNATEGIEGVGSGEATVTECKTAGGSTFKVKNLKLTNIKSSASESGKGTASFSFTTYELPQECTFTGTNDAGTYTPETSVIKFEKGPLTVTGTNCGTATIDWEWAIESSGSVSIFFM